MNWGKIIYRWKHCVNTLWLIKSSKGNSLIIQGLARCASTAGGAGSIPGQGTMILQVAKYSPKWKDSSILSLGGWGGGGLMTPRGDS